MVDEAHEWTDEQIEALRRKYAQAYREAEREMRQKLEASMRDFETQNERWRQAVRNGDRTDRQWREWREDQLQDQRWIRDMADTLASDAANANQIAADDINDMLPRVYAENANRAAYAIESAVGREIGGFGLYDVSTVRRLMGMGEHDQLIHEVIPVGPPHEPLQSLRVHPDRVKDVEWNRQKFTSAITQSILQGESIPHTAERLSRVLKMDESMATRAARTAMTSAENAGRVDSYKRAKSLGIDLEQQWMATLDGRTRHSHRLLDGQHVPVGEKFKVDGVELEYPGDPSAPGEYTWNCFVGSTLAATDSEVERSYCHEYKGELVTVNTSAGVKFTCTPNHPILTPDGWVAAKLLHRGDDVLVTRRIDRLRPDGYPDVDHVFPSFEAIHKLFDIASTERTTSCSVNFHGDVPTSDVEIISEKSLLRLCLNSSRDKNVVDVPLERANPLRLCEGTPMEGLRRVAISASRIMGCLRIGASFLWGHGSHADTHGLRATARNDSSVSEYSINDLPAETMIRSELVHGLSGQVIVDKVISVEVSSTGGTQVYNLQTKNGYYFVNGASNGNFIIAKNCRCTLVAWSPTMEADDPARNSKLPKGMSYDDWKGMKEQRQPDDGNPETLGGVRRGEPMDFDKANELRGNPKYNMADKAYDELTEARRAYNRAIDEHGFSSPEYLDASRRYDDARREYNRARREQEGYRINCQTCVVANEARRRGYDVQATANTSGSVNARVSHNTNLAWIDPATGRHPEYIRYDGAGRTDVLGRPIPTPRRFTDWLLGNGTIEEGARYTIEHTWRGRSLNGHIICLERTPEGLRMYDPQCGEIYDEAGIRRYFQTSNTVAYSVTRYGNRYSVAPQLLKVSEYEFDTDICNQILEEAR